MGYYGCELRVVVLRATHEQATLVCDIFGRTVIAQTDCVCLHCSWCCKVHGCTATAGRQQFTSADPIPLPVPAGEHN
eukprot:217434-Alexandrium_andersonii.AAC.1